MSNGLCRLHVVDLSIPRVGRQRRLTLPLLILQIRNRLTCVSVPPAIRILILLDPDPQKSLAGSKSSNHIIAPLSQPLPFEPLVSPEISYITSDVHRSVHRGPRRTHHTNALSTRLSVSFMYVQHIKSARPRAAGAATPYLAISYHSSHPNLAEVMSLRMPLVSAGTRVPG